MCFRAVSRQYAPARPQTSIRVELPTRSPFHYVTEARAVYSTVLTEHAGHHKAIPRINCHLIVVITQILTTDHFPGMTWKRRSLIPPTGAPCICTACMSPRLVRALIIAAAWPRAQLQPLALRQCFAGLDHAFLSHYLKIL